jgi:hypothetical protein
MPLKRTGAAVNPFIFSKSRRWDAGRKDIASSAGLKTSFPRQHHRPHKQFPPWGFSQNPPHPQADLSTLAAVGAGCDQWQNQGTAWGKVK